MQHFQLFGLYAGKLDIKSAQQLFPETIVGFHSNLSVGEFSVNRNNLHKKLTGSFLPWDK